MDNAAIFDQIVQSLSFDVEAIPQGNVVQLTSRASTTPVNVKVRLRKKERDKIPDHNIAVISKHDPPNSSTRLRLASSDQTIISFNMLMEADLKNIIHSPKPRKRFFNGLISSVCLGNKSDDDEFPYLPSSNSHEDDSKNVYMRSKNDLNKNVNIHEDDYTFEGGSRRKHKNFFGKCKPGGCLDPPFGEEKYIYKPTKKPHSDKSNMLKNKSPVKTEQYVTRKSSSLKSAIDSTEKQEEPSPVVSIYEGVSKNKSLDKTHSHSIITYPPDDLKYYDSKHVNEKTSYEITHRRQESADSYFLPPKKKKTEPYDQKYSQKEINQKQQDQILAETKLQDNSGQKKTYIEPILLRLPIDKSQTETYQKRSENEPTQDKTYNKDNLSNLDIQMENVQDEQFDSVILDQEGIHQERNKQKIIPVAKRQEPFSARMFNIDQNIEATPKIHTKPSVPKEAENYDNLEPHSMPSTSTIEDNKLKMQYNVNLSNIFASKKEEDFEASSEEKKSFLEDTTKDVSSQKINDYQPEDKLYQQVDPLRSKYSYENEFVPMVPLNSIRDVNQNFKNEDNIEIGTDKSLLVPSPYSNDASGLDYDKHDFEDHPTNKEETETLTINNAPIKIVGRDTEDTGKKSNQETMDLSPLSELGVELKTRRQDNDQDKMEKLELKNKEMKVTNDSKKIYMAEEETQGVTKAKSSSFTFHQAEIHSLENDPSINRLDRNLSEDNISMSDTAKDFESKLDFHDLVSTQYENTALLEPRTRKDSITETQDISNPLGDLQRPRRVSIDPMENIKKKDYLAQKQENSSNDDLSSNTFYEYTQQKELLSPRKSDINIVPLDKLKLKSHLYVDEFVSSFDQTTGSLDVTQSDRFGLDMKDQSLIESNRLVTPTQIFERTGEVEDFDGMEIPYSTLQTRTEESEDQNYDLYDLKSSHNDDIKNLTPEGMLHGSTENVGQNIISGQEVKDNIFDSDQRGGITDNRGEDILDWQDQRNYANEFDRSDFSVQDDQLKNKYKQQYTIDPDIMTQVNSQIIDGQSIKRLFSPDNSDFQRKEEREAEPKRSNFLTQEQQESNFQAHKISSMNILKDSPYIPEKYINDTEEMNIDNMQNIKDLYESPSMLTSANKLLSDTSRSPSFKQRSVYSDLDSNVDDQTNNIKSQETPKPLQFRQKSSDSVIETKPFKQAIDDVEYRSYEKLDNITVDKQNVPWITNKTTSESQRNIMVDGQSNFVDFPSKTDKKAPYDIPGNKVFDKPRERTVVSPKLSPSILKTGSKEDSITLDLAFQIFTEETKGTLIKTLSRDQADAYPGNAIVVNGTTKLNDSVKISLPGNREMNLRVLESGYSQKPSQLKNINQIIRRKISESGYSDEKPMGFNYYKNDAETKMSNAHMTRTPGSQDSMILGRIYEEQLVPLKFIIENIKTQIDSISDQQLLIRKRLTELRKAQIKNKIKMCGCINKHYMK